MNKLTQIQIQVLEGALLGDGSLIIGKNGKNASFYYCSKSYQHIEFISSLLKDYDETLGKITKYSYLDKRTNKVYTRYSIRSRVHEELTKIYYKWYKDKKTLPKDLILTPLSILIWYIGDGGLINSNYSQYIKLSTQCFNKEEQESILIYQLKLFEAKLMKADIGSNNKQQYFIYIPHRKIQDFLNYIGPCPFLDYSYKWNFKEYINKKPYNHTSLEKEFCEDYLKGDTYYQIAKRYSVEPTVVKYYLVKNNLYKATSAILRNAVIQKDKEQYINIFKSGSDAAKAMNLASGATISQACSGKRKTAGGYEWIKYNSLSCEKKLKVKEKFKKFFEENGL